MILGYDVQHKTVLHIKKYQEPLFKRVGSDFILDLSQSQLGVNTDWLVNAYFYDDNSREKYLQVSSNGYVRYNNPDMSDDNNFTPHMFTTVDGNTPNVIIQQNTTNYDEPEWDNHNKQTISSAFQVESGLFNYPYNLKTGDAFNSDGGLEIPRYTRNYYGYKVDTVNYYMSVLEDGAVKGNGSNSNNANVHTVAKPFYVVINSITPHIYDLHGGAVWFEHTMGDTFKVTQVYAGDYQVGYMLDNNTIIDVHDSKAISRATGSYLPEIQGVD